MTNGQLRRIETMSYIDLDTKTCSGIVEGAHGSIFSNSCPTTLDFNEAANIDITCKNIGTSSGIFVFQFCVSSPPFDECDIQLYGSETFSLNPDETKDFTRPIIMPNNQVLYAATVQRLASEWVIDETVPCMISLTGASLVAQGKIMTYSCPDSLTADQTTGITIRCKNVGTASGLFKMVFCVSLPPAVDCGISSPIPEEFTLNAGMTKDITIPIVMPNSPISYSATIKHKDGESWITDDTKSCDISLTSPPVAEAGGSAILIGGLAVGALVMMMSKKK